MEYLIILFLLGIGVYRYDSGRHAFSNKYYYFLLFLIFLISGLSYRLGVDVIRYENMFDSNYSGAFKFKDLFDNSGIESAEPFWVVLNWFVHSAFGEFWVLKLIIAIWVNSVIFWFIKRNTSAPFMALLTYCLLQFFEINFQVLRESLSISFFLIALDQYFRRGLKWYYLWIIPAFFFHRFAFILLLFPLLFNIKFDKRVVYLLLFVLVVAPFTASLMGSIVNLNMFNVIIGERIDSLMDNETYGLRSRNIFGIIEVFALFLIPVLLLLKNQKNSTFLSLSIAYVLTILLKMSAFTILYRLNNYLVFPFAVSISIALQNSLYKHDFTEQTVSMMRNKSLVLLCVVIFYGNSIKKITSSEDFVMYYPYSSILTKDMNMNRENYYNDLIHFYY